jgi:hypothetical protein
VEVNLALGNEKEVTQLFTASVEETQNLVAEDLL